MYRYALLMIFSLFWLSVISDYVTYIKTGNKYEPVMEPVSSTIEPIPIYKIPRMNNDDNLEYEKNTILTGTNTSTRDKITNVYLKKKISQRIHNTTLRTYEGEPQCYGCHNTIFDMSKSPYPLDDYDFIYGCETGMIRVGDAIADLSINDTSNCQHKPVDHSRKMTNKFCRGEACDSSANKKNHLEVIEKHIPEELEDINASLYSNEYVEQEYYQKFPRFPAECKKKKSKFKPEIKVEIPSSPSPSTSRTKPQEVKKDRKERNVLLKSLTEGTYQPKMRNFEFKFRAEEFPAIP